MMSASLPIHVLAGGLGLLSGYLALYATKHVRGMQKVTTYELSNVHSS